MLEMPVDSLGRLWPHLEENIHFSIWYNQLKPH